MRGRPHGKNRISSRCMPSKPSAISVTNPTRGLVTRSLQSFRAHASFPSEGIAAPEFVPGINWSDHWSFWKQGYPAVMITDTAPYRYPHYHGPGDTPDKVDYEKMVPLVRGIEKMLQDMLVPK